MIVQRGGRSLGKGRQEASEVRSSPELAAFTRFVPRAWETPLDTSQLRKEIIRVTVDPAKSAARLVASTSSEGGDATTWCEATRGCAGGPILPRPSLRPQPCQYLRSEQILMRTRLKTET